MQEGVDVLVESLLEKHGYFIVLREGTYRCFNLIGIETILVSEISPAQFRQLQTHSRIGQVMVQRRICNLVRRAR